jgi:hypothetical protein
MLRTRNLIQKVNDPQNYNTAVQQIGGIQRARYKTLNNQFNNASDASELVRNGNYFIYENLYDLQREVLTLEAHIYNYKSRATETCNSSCDTCQSGFSII